MTRFSWHLVHGFFFVAVLALLVIGVLAVALLLLSRFSRFRILRGLHIAQKVRLTSAGKAFVILTFLIGLAAINSKANLLYLMLGMMLGLFVVSGLLSTFTLQGVTVERFLPRHLFAREDFGVRLDVRNRKYLLPSFSLDVRDAPDAPLVREGPARHLVKIPPRGSTSLHYSLAIARRGAYSFEKTEIWTGFPFGFVERQIVDYAKSPLLVYPQLGELRTDLIHSDVLFAEDQNRRERSSASEDEFRSLRQYRPGDNPRRIHWKSSARLGKTMVREYEGMPTRNVTVVLDPSCPSDGDGALLERAISFVGTLVKELLAANCRVVFAAYTPELTVVSSGHGSFAVGGQLYAILEALALLEPPRDATLESLLQEDELRKLVRGHLAIVTARRGAEARAALGEASSAEVFDVASPDLDSVFVLP